MLCEVSQIALEHAHVMFEVIIGCPLCACVEV